MAPGLMAPPPAPPAPPPDTAQTPPPPPPPVVPLPADASRKPLDDFLAKIAGADQGQMSALKDDVLELEFPDYKFYSIHFRAYRGAKPVPATLKAADVFALAPDGTVTQFDDLDSLKSFFWSKLSGIQRTDQARDALKAWMKLAVEYKQDGYYEFSGPDKVNTTSPTDAKGLTATSKVNVKLGGHGTIGWTLSFGQDGKITDYSVADNVTPGIRPQ
jgi:hypothetical protein